MGEELSELEYDCKVAHIAQSTIDCVMQELKCQWMKWGRQNHDPHKWITILMEEVGEASKDILEEDFNKARTELVQVAAVAISMIESIERNQIQQKETP